MAFLADWIKKIIFVVLFASFLELILPNSSMQRFIRVVLGLLIMLVIIGPVIDIVQKGVVPGEIPALTGKTSSSKELFNAAGFLSERDRISFNIYKRDLAQQMKTMVTAIDGVADADVIVEVYEADNKKMEGRIKRVVVYVQPGPTKQGKISGISIGKNENAYKNKLTIELQSRIKDTIATLYQIPPDCIEVRNLHN